MKKILIAFLFIAAAAAGVLVTGTISTSGPADTYATHDSEFGRGGLLNTSNQTLIPAPRLRPGMIAAVNDATGTTAPLWYVLGADTNTWNLINPSNLYSLAGNVQLQLVTNYNVTAQVTAGGTNALFTTLLSSSAGLYGITTNYLAFTSNSLLSAFNSSINSASNSVLGTTASTYLTLASGATTANLNSASNAINSTITNHAPALYSHWYNCANNVDMMGSTANGAYTSFGVATARTKHVIFSKGFGLKLRYNAIYTTLTAQSDTYYTSGTPETFYQVGIEYTSLATGVTSYITNITFAHNSSTILNPGKYIETDPIWIPTNPGDTIAVRTSFGRIASASYGNSDGSLGLGQSADSSYTFMSAISIRGTSGTLNTGEGVFFENYTYSTGGNPYTNIGCIAWQMGTSIAGSANLCMRPLEILTLSNPSNAHSVVIVGDSIGGGVGDAQLIEVNGGRGFVRRALNQYTAFVEDANGGDKLAYWLDANGTCVRHGLVQDASSVICELGSNDLAQGTNAVQCETEMLTLWNLWRQLGLAQVWQTTILPRTSSTDGFRTTNNQNISTAGGFNTNQPAVNAWLRAGAPIVNGAVAANGATGAIYSGNAYHPLTGVIDVDAAVEVGAPSAPTGYWISSTTTNYTGTTTSATTTSLLVDTSQSWSTTSQNGLGDTVGLYAFFPSLSNGALCVPQTTATATNAALNGTVSGLTSGLAYIMIPSYTQEGTHPSPRGHALMATMISTNGW